MYGIRPGDEVGLNDSARRRRSLYSILL